MRTYDNQGNQPSPRHDELRGMLLKFDRRTLLKLGSAASGAAALAFAGSVTGGGVQPRLAPAALGAAKQEIVIAQGAAPETLDPHATTTRSTWNVAATIYETLTNVAFTKSGQASVEPALAESWKASGSDTWEISLRKGVKFHNGEPFDANAAKFSIDRLMDKTQSFVAAEYAAGVKSVDVIDGLTLRITTNGPYPLMPLDLTNVYMVPPEYTSKTPKAQFAREPIGTGPFKFVEWVQDDHVTVAQNPDYWRTPPALTKVTFRPIPEAATRSAALVTGNVDVATLLAIPDVSSLKQADGVTVDVGPSQRCVYVVFNQSSAKAMQNEKVRQALNYAVDKDAIIKHVMQGYATELQGQTITAQYFGFNPDLKPYPYDPDMAKSLLAQAGYPKGFDATIYSSRGRYILDYETTQAVAGQLQQVGVNATAKPLEWAVYIKDLAGRSLSPMIYEAWSTYNDGQRMFQVFKTGGSYSVTSVPAFDKLYAEASTEVNSDKRKAIIQQMAKLQHDQALALFLYQLQNIYGYRNRVKGFVLLPNEAFDLYGVSVS